MNTALPIKDDKYGNSCAPVPNKLLAVTWLRANHSANICVIVRNATKLPFRYAVNEIAHIHTIYVLHPQINIILL